MAGHHLGREVGSRELAMRSLPAGSAYATGSSQKVLNPKEIPS